MKIQTLKELCCPYCAAALEVSEGIDIKGDEINQALVKCNCNIYPLVAGILVLKNDIPNSNYLAVSSLKNRRPQEAMYYLIKPKITFDWFIRQAHRRKLIFSHFADTVRLKLSRQYAHKIVDRFCFAETLRYLKIGGYGDYFLHRFCSTSFLASLPMILMLEGFAGPVLEIGSGMGHHGFMLSSLYPQKKLVCVDTSFINLFLTKRFFAPQAEFICLDANDPLPFTQRQFNIVFSSDTLHYLYSKRLVMQEIARVAGENAIILLAHLHNLGGQNPVAGNPLTAEGWLKLSSFSHTKLLPEPQVFHNFLQQDTWNLLDNFTFDQIEKSNAFMLVASNHPEVFKNYSKIGERYFYPDNRLIVNPLYRQQKKGSSVVLHKAWPTDFIQAENHTVDEIIPDTCVLDDGIIRSVCENNISSPDIPKIIALMKKFIIIHAPENYYSSS